MSASLGKYGMRRKPGMLRTRGRMGRGERILQVLLFIETMLMRFPFLRRRLRMIRYAMMGGFGVLAQLSMLALLVTLGMGKNSANILAIETGILTSFVGQRAYTFRDRSGSLLRQLWQFHMFTLLGAFVQMLVFLLLTDVLIGHDMLWKLLLSSMIGLLAGFLVNYPLNAKITFRHEGEA